MGTRDPEVVTSDMGVREIMRFRMNLRPWAIVLGLCMAMLSANAQDAAKKQNFSGRWRMVKELSDFGTFTRPDIITRVVDQRGPTMNVHTVQTTGRNTSTSDVSYFTDGRSTTNVMSGREATSKVFWDGPALMVRTETKDSKNNEIEIVDRWELSSDGSVLTITSHIGGPTGGADLKLVCRKE
jgi:hypothetical protein